ncbi:methyltransferase domain-containing protein [candidate division GN15 bacterium]|nr:methyltransferase domain-containing protein [candidate division GN15 bacterium]
MKDSIRRRLQQRFWERFAPLYDPFMAVVARSYPRLVSRMVDRIESDADILEVAAGTGIVSLKLAPHVARVMGTDLSPKMIARANHKLKQQRRNGVAFAVADAYRLGCDDASFDATVCVNGLHLMHDPARPLSEMARVLKPGGVLLCATYLHAQSLRARFFSRVIKLGGVKVANEFTIGSMGQLIAGSGFALESQEVLSDIMPLGYIVAVKPDRQ